MEKTIVRYYRKGGKLRGCVIGIIQEHTYKLGWSLYHKRLEEEAGIPFTKKEARKIALERATSIPHSLKTLHAMVGNQCLNMFTGGNKNAREDVTSTDKD